MHATSELERAVLKLLEHTQFGRPALDVDGQGLECSTSEGGDAVSETVFSVGNSGTASETEDNDDEDFRRGKGLTKAIIDSRSLTTLTSPVEPESELRQRHRDENSPSSELVSRPFEEDASASVDEYRKSGDRRRRRIEEFEDDYPLVRSTSWAVSCFVCGVLVTLFVLSSQRRDLLAGNRLT